MLHRLQDIDRKQIAYRAFMISKELAMGGDFILQAVKNDLLEWTQGCEDVFDKVKEVLSTLPIMQAPDLEKEFYVNPSVGDDAIGAMLLQKGKESQYMKPVHYANRVKTLHERDYSEIELVMTSMVYACRRFRHYLLQKSFTFLTSYSLLPQLFNNSNISKTVMKWVIKLQEFQFTFLVEESTRVTLADLLTYKGTPILIKEDVVQKKKVETFAISNASLLYFDGSYRRSHDAASGGIVVYDAQGKLVRKQGLKLDAKSNNEAEYMALEGGLHICLQMGIKRLQIKGDALLVVKQHIERSQNEEVHHAAQEMITCVFVLKANAPLYHGREMLSKEVDFLLTGILPEGLLSSKKIRDALGAILARAAQTHREPFEEIQREITDFFRVETRQSKEQDPEQPPGPTCTRGILIDRAMELGRSRRPRLRGSSLHR
ncbi:hypothetical protein L7F22_030491 [Adiantum nelumboides]|nr:hypothetical protein [Adiantum nelumboides]